MPVTHAIEPQFITSRDNPLIKRLRQLSRDSTAYRKLGQVWLEGDHLGRALLQRGVQPAVVVICESKWPLSLDLIGGKATKIVVIPDALMGELTALESATFLGFVVDLPAMPALDVHAPTVVLDRVQDAGNVGSILRSSGAFGFKQVVALKGTAALWSTKVVRAGMGAHFGLHLLEGLEADALSALQVPLVVTSSHQGDWVHNARLPWPCAWVMGHEGQGVGPELMARAQHHIRIAQPGGEESLNVAAAAAICLHASAPKP